MHYHCEIILPSGTDDIEAAIASVMRQFDENIDEDDEEFSSRNAFWDFYVIGGRFAGSKQLAKYDESKLEQFYQWMRDEQVTVSSLRCGKQELSPASQIGKVDAKWNEMFSTGGVMVACPIFAHSNDQYGRDGNGTIEGDISTLRESRDVKCSRVIFTGASYDSEANERTGPLEAVFMLCDSAWNGVNHMGIAWDGTIGAALDLWQEKLQRYKEGYRDQMSPEDDWIVVTVDYHS